MEKKNLIGCKQNLA